MAPFLFGKAEAYELKTNLVSSMSTSVRKEADKVPEPTLRRLPWYLSNIKLMKERGERYVSSTQISKEINIDASQIAKDLSYVNISGRTRVGYNIDALIEVLETFLGFTNMHKAFLFGVGSLGGALLRDSGLHHFGLEIVAAFDVNPQLIGKDINGIPIFHSDDFERKMQEYDVNIGVLTVPINIAQEILINGVYAADMSVDFSSGLISDKDLLDRRLNGLIKQSELYINNNESFKVECDTIHFDVDYGYTLDLIKEAHNTVEPRPVNYNKVVASGWVE